MDKEQLIQRIENIPKFVKRDVAIRGIEERELIEVEGNKVRVDNWKEDEKNKAVTEEGNLIPLAFVSEGYQLVQFNSVFLPLIQNIEELDGDIMYYKGVGYMDVFPKDERLKVNGGDKIGLVSMNSVNKTCSVIIKFCVSHNNKRITIPKSLAGFKRMHTGKAIQITSNFLVVVDKVRQIWKTIIEEFTKIKVNETYADAVLDDINIKENYIRKKVTKKIMATSDMDLWDLFLYIIEIVEERKFKSDLHRRKKLDIISEKLFKHAVASKLINA